MLDDTEGQPVEEVIEADAAEEAPQEAEAEEVVIGFDGEEPAEEVEPETPLIKKLRQELKEKSRAEREATRRLAEIEAAKAPQPIEAKPTIESCGYDDAVFEAKLGEWFEGKAKRDAADKAQRDAETARQAEFTGRISTYDEQKASLRVADFADAEDSVRNALSIPQQAIILRHIDQPAAFVYALGKNPAKMAEIAALTDLDAFAFAIAKLEGKVTVNTRKAPPPETKLPGSAAGITTSANLAAMKAKAQASGDYGAYFAAKRQAEAAGRKV